MGDENYTGPETNELYNDPDVYESFDDIGDDFPDEEDASPQSATSYEGDGEDDEEEQEKVVKATKSKKEDAKKARGQKGDDLDALTLGDDEEEEEAPKTKKTEEEEEEEKEEGKAPEVKPEEKKDTPKGKPTYLKIGEETFAVPSDAIIPVKIDGKVENLTLQELKNAYSGEKFYDKKINEVNLKEQAIKREQSQFQEKISQFTGVKQKIEEIIKDPEKNPKDALKIFLEQFDVDTYDLMERMFKADLTELANVLNMEPAERKAYFLEKRNGHLLEQSKKRDEQRQTEMKRNSYTQKVNALRNSYGVSEAQYVDALEELKSYGATDEELTETQIVEWAATKPHRAEIKTILEPYKDQFSEDAYGELSWKLAKILQSGTETPDNIKKHLAEVYGVPTTVRELSKKLNPVGRKPQTPAKPAPKKFSYESFDDIDDD